MPAQVWKEVYEALLQERDRSKLAMRCDQADQAINERFRELLEKPSEDTDERLALAKALHNVAVLRASLSDNPGSRPSRPTQRFPYPNHPHG
jgi:hypothetical protein